jgi:hypothetical protein
MTGQSRGIKGMDKVEREDQERRSGGCRVGV